MPTIKNHFSNMYGNGKNLNVSKNKTVNELLNNIPNIKINTNSNSNTSTNNLSHSNGSNTHGLNVMNTSTSIYNGTGRFNIYYILIILFIVIIIGLIIYFKDIIIDNYNKYYDKYMSKKDVPDDTPKVDTHKMDELENKLDTLIKKDCQPAINKLNTKIEDASYTKEQKSTEAGFCYIGYDNGQRDCIDIYEGDVCMSGQIFSSLDICINPKLRP